MFTCENYKITNNLMHRGDALEAAVPCLIYQLRGEVRVIACKCGHNYMPGHAIRKGLKFCASLGLDNKALERLLKELENIQDIDTIINNFCYSSVGRPSRRMRIKRLWEKCLSCTYNPVGNHPGKMLKLCYEQEEKYPY